MRFWSPNENPFWKMDWRKFDINAAAKSVLVTLSLTIFAMIFAVFILHFVYPDPLIVGFVLLAIATLGHLIARLFEPETPSFHTEAEKGTLDFLRLLPFSAHQTVLVRAFPAFAFRLYLTILWLPLYLAAFNILGVSKISTCSFANIVGLGSPNLVFLFPMCLRSPTLMQLMHPLLFAILVAALLPLRVSNSVKLLAKINVFFVPLALGFGLDFDLDKSLSFYTGTLPLLQATALLFLASGLAHIDRTARWLESPKGLRRLFFAVPVAIMLFVTQGFLWGYLQQELRWQPSDCFIVCAGSTFAFGGFLFWLWQNWSWAEKSVPTKEPFAFLTEAIALRVVILLMPFIGCWLSGISLSQLDVNFVNFWLWLNLADVVNLAISRSIALRVLACRKMSGVMWLALISNLPCLALLSAKFSWIAAFSPSAALVGLTVGVLEGKPISLTLPLLRLQLAIHPIPLIATFLMPTILRASLLWTAWSVWRSLLVFKESGASKIFERIQPALQKLNRIAEWIFLFPALESMVRERTDNPVLRHFLTVTRWRFTWQPYLLAFIVGWLLPSPFGIMSLFLSYFVI